MESELPKQIVVLVDDTDEDEEAGFVHKEIHASSGDCTIYLVPLGHQLPKPGELVVLKCTYERPSWWDEDDDAGGGTVTYLSPTGKYQDTYLWEVVRDEQA